MKKINYNLIKLKTNIYQQIYKLENKIKKRYIIYLYNLTLKLMNDFSLFVGKRNS